MTKTIYVLSHNPELLWIADVGHDYYKVYLNNLHIGTKHNSNLYGECRAFLCDFEISDVTGIVNARWNNKYPKISTRLADLSKYIDLCNIKPNEVHAPWTCPSNWYTHTINVHPDMKKLLDELKEFSGLEFNDDKPTLCANDMIMCKQTMHDWLAFWRKCFHHFDNKYGALLPMMYHNMDPSRGPAYFYERITALYFANRPDLKIIQIL